LTSAVRLGGQWQWENRVGLVDAPEGWFILRVLFYETNKDVKIKGFSRIFRH
jgi:hypothetical protein